jgi:lysophospholipase L1-like esterase
VERDSLAWGSLQRVRSRKDGMRQGRSVAKTVLFSLITIGLSIVFSFAILEFGLAKFYAATEEESSENVFDLTLGWKPAPGSRWVKPAHTLRAHTISINQLGLRNRELSPGKQNDVTRVVLLGDSFTFAKAVRTEEMFSSLLESHLNQTGRFEVINAGVPGYGTAQELLLMKELASKKIVGDVYVLMFFNNDILDNLRLDYGNLQETPARPGFALMKDGELKEVSYPRKEYSESLVPSRTGSAGFVTVEVVKRQVASFIQPRPWLANLITRMGFEQKMPRMPGVINGWYRDEVLEAGVPLTRALIKEIQAEARRHGAILLVSMIPSPIEVYPDIYHPILKNTFPHDKSVEDYFDDPTRPQRIIGNICRELEIPVLDLLPILLSSNDRELYIPLEGHFTVEGHAVVARELTRFIEEQSSVPRSAPY